jgi:glutamyl-tRNA synthetase
MTVKVRFAPSPTGWLHVGNIRAAITNWLFARRAGGTFVLRIDDTDLARSTAEYERGIETDLTWLGLTWDERHKQSARFDRYQAAADRLRAEGRLYPAYDTQEELDRRRKVQLSRGLPPIYDRAALKLTEADRAALEAEGRKPHWRFRLEGRRVKWADLIRGDNEVDTTSLSDPVLIREDGAFLYTLPSVVDDIDMDITHVIRGEDHVTNTGVQIELFEALGAAVPGFAHFSLLIGAELGTSDAIEAAPSVADLIAAFDIDKLGRAPARYDSADLARLNAGVLHAMDYAAAKSRLEALGCDLGEAFWLAVRANLAKFADAADWARVVQGPVTPMVEDAAFLASAAALLPATLDAEAWKAWTEAVKQATGAKGRALFAPLRAALTGLDHGPDMGPLLPLIGRDRAIKRLDGESA